MLMQNILTKYADLLVRYCLDIQPGDRLLVRSTTLAEPLVREVFRAAVAAGAHVETELTFREQYRILLAEASDDQLRYVSPFYRLAMEDFEAYLYIRAPFNLREDQSVDPQRSRIRQEASREVQQTYFRRTADRSLKRNLCQYPTQAAAQEAGMSLEEYESFVYGACKLTTADPVASWLDVRHRQHHIVDHLNQCDHFHYRGDGIDLTFSTQGRRWINSDGQTNMPSGEVYTSPVEDSVNGVVRFSFPAVYMGHEVEDATLWVKDGYIEKWETRKTPFDEKMGGTVHLAIGQSYLQAGGRNSSSVHWDMITDMQADGEIFADGEKIYEKGKFLIG